MTGSETLPPSRTKHTLKDLSNHVFGNLRVISRAGTYEKKKSKEATWECECVKCSHRSIVRGNFLRTGKNRGKNCPGCKPDRSGEPALVIDRHFVNKYESLIFASIGKVISFSSKLYQSNKLDIAQEVLLELAKHRGDVPEAAMSSLIWRISRSRAINFLQRALRDTSVHAAADGEDENSYEFILESLTDASEQSDSSSRQCLMQQVFDELTDDEQTFAKSYIEAETPKTGADKQRMFKLRKHLSARLHEKAAESHPQLEVYDPR